MKQLRHFLCLAMLYPMTCVQAQADRFEWQNPRALALGDQQISLLTSGYWRIYEDEMRTRNGRKQTRKNVSICYYPDGKLFFNGHEGTWRVINGEIIEHRLNDRQQEGRLNFGGPFAVTDLGSDHVTLEKTLTTSGDMLRIISMRKSSTLTLTEQRVPPGTYVDKPLTEARINTLRGLSDEELFHEGFLVSHHGVLSVVAPDTTYFIRLRRDP